MSLRDLSLAHPAGGAGFFYDSGAGLAEQMPTPPEDALVGTISAELLLQAKEQDVLRGTKDDALVRAIIANWSCNVGPRA